MREALYAVDAATDLRAHARDLRRQWDATFGGTRARGRVRPVIARSWSRMTGAGLDPAHLRPRSAFDADDLEAARVDSPLRDALPALRHHLGTIADEAEHVLVVCDAAGRILWLEGHPRVLETARGIEFAAGMSWTETSAGTNAIGTALAIDHAVQVFSAEHFLPEQHPWWCSAAPIHDPVTGELVGVVDISGPAPTAHPYSLALVSAAAKVAEHVLRQRQVERDNRLREAYLERTRLASTGPSALVDGRGRVLSSTPTGWVSGAVPPPRAPGPVRLAGGTRADAEPLDGDGWVLWSTGGGRGVRHRTLELRLLGRHGHRMRIDDGDPAELSLRHAEALALLAMYPDGLSTEQLTLHLYGDDGKAVTTRSLMSRLRRLLGPCLRGRPYRLCAEVRADFLEVLRLVHAGHADLALARYRGPLLVESAVLRIEDARNELAAALRRVAISSGPDALWAWLETDHGRDDLHAMDVFLQRTGWHDPRRAAIAARRQSLEAA